MSKASDLNLVVMIGKALMIERIFCLIGHILGYIVNQFFKGLEI